MSESVPFPKASEALKRAPLPVLDKTAVDTGQSNSLEARATSRRVGHRLTAWVIVFDRPWLAAVP